MKARRLVEFVLLLCVIAVAGYFGLYRLNIFNFRSELREFSYSMFPVQYSLKVCPDGSGSYEASYDCVMATPEPGKPSCQHLRGKVSKEQVQLLWARLQKAHLDHLEATPANRPALLMIRYANQTVIESDPEQAARIFASLGKLQPGKVIERLKTLQAEERMKVRLNMNGGFNR